MANRFTEPLPQFVDSTGTPYSGAQLFFYSAGTSTKLTTYSDNTLATPNANPMVLDSFGRVPNAVFLQNLAYKVILAPATDTDPPSSPYWTQDQVYSSDFSAQAKFLSGSGSPTGTVAGTAGSAGVSASSYWDFTNNILYICTATGNAASAVWTAVNASTSAVVVPAPQGRLTLTSATPVLNADVTAATTVYYTPYTGLLVPIYNGTSFVPTSIVSEQQITLVASHTANNIYDFFEFSNSGVPTLGTGPSWSAGTSGSITAGSCARGTGTGGAALASVQGIPTNAVSMTIRYGNGTVTATVPANQATYLGSMFVDGSNGQVSCLVGFGQSRKCGIWNAYNRVRTVLLVGDGTASWSGNASGLFRASNGASANLGTVFAGLPYEGVDNTFVQYVNGASTGAAACSIGIGLNSTTVASGKTGSFLVQSVSSTGSDLVARYTLPPFIGINNIQCLEKDNTNGGTRTFSGTQANMQMTSAWLA